MWRARSSVCGWWVVRGAPKRIAVIARRGVPSVTANTKERKAGCRYHQPMLEPTPSTYLASIPQI